jgi:hypothetical protein
MPDGFKVRRILPMMGPTDISQLKAIGSQLKAIGVEADNRTRTKIIYQCFAIFWLCDISAAALNTHSKSLKSTTRKGDPVETRKRKLRL